jgi:hypothetical protein
VQRLFTLVLGPLVVVGRLDGRLLAGGRVVDIAVNAAGAAINKAADLGLDGRFGHRAHAPHVHVVIERVRHVHLAESGGQVINRVHASHGAGHDGGVGHGADDHLGAGLAQLAGPQAFLVIEGNDGVPFLQEPEAEGLARKSGSPGDQTLHRLRLLAFPAD